MINSGSKAASVHLVSWYQNDVIVLLGVLLKTAPTIRRSEGQDAGEVSNASYLIAFVY